MWNKLFTRFHFFMPLLMCRQWLSFSFGCWFFVAKASDNIQINGKWFLGPKLLFSTFSHKRTKKSARKPNDSYLLCHLPSIYQHLYPFTKHTNKKHTKSFTKMQCKLIYHLLSTDSAFNFPHLRLPNFFSSPIYEKFTFFITIGQYLFCQFLSETHFSLK